MSNNAKSIAYGLVAVLSWSTVATAFKITLKYLTHFEMVLVASVTALCVFAAVVTIQRKWGEIRHLSAREWGHFALLGLLNPVAYYLVLFAAYDMLPAHVAQPINYTWPIILVVMLAIFAKQSIPAHKYLGMAISLGGVAMISFGSSHGDGAALPLMGIVCCVLSAVLWATYWMVNNSKKQSVDGNLALFLGFFFGTLYLLVAAPFVGINLTSVPGILAGMYVGGFEMGIPFVFFALALRTTTNPSLINQLSYLAPFLSLFFIAMVLGESITLSTVAGLILIVAGIVFNELR